MSRRTFRAGPSSWINRSIKSSFMRSFAWSFIPTPWCVSDGCRPWRKQTDSDFDTGSGQPLVLTYLLLFIVSQAVPCVTIF
ncbi:hypothetical protein ABZ760_30855, partial [Streptomyces sp. NPDC006658]|uniref:hypothetical protein n=1 Tax=Streptomyces sp. NPDC006658 TaxID=3156900 RepID=UPI0033DEA53C